MKKGKLKDNDLDILLKRTLKDDLPADLEKRMQSGIDKFKEKVLTKNSHPMLEKIKNKKFFFGLRWAFRKEIVATAALIMVISGAYLHTSGSKSVFSENIALLGTSIQVSDRLNNAVNMVCFARIELLEGERVKYLIRWLSPGLTRVDITKIDGRPIKTIWFSDANILVSDHDLNTVSQWESIHQIEDPVIKPVLDIISPQLLSDSLRGRWQLKDYTLENNKEIGHFLINVAEKETNLEVSIDMNTFLPVKAKKLAPDSGIGTKGHTVMEIEFNWNTVISPDLMRPEIHRNDREA